MSFDDTLRFPVNVSIHFVGGPGYQTDIVVVNSGAESRNANWALARHQYEAGEMAKLPAVYQPIKAFFHAVKGRALPFRFKDWLDFQVDHGNGVVGSGVAGFGDGRKTAYLGKKYTAGATTTVRTINKPITANAPALKKNGIALNEGVLPGNWEVDLSSGLITFTATTTKNITGITNANPAVVTSASHGFTNGQTVFIESVVGMTQVNNLPFIAANVATNTFQLSGINSSAYGTYSAGGTASIYPQPIDTLTWEGEFDVPCRFDIDQMRGEVMDKHKNGDLIVSWSSIPIVEVRDFR